MQSPKSQRSHGPGENPASDNNPTDRSGGTHAGRHGSEQARSKQHVPNHSPVGHAGAGKGNESGYSSVPVNSACKSKAGKAGYAESAEAKKKGGTDHLFPGGSG